MATDGDEFTLFKYLSRVEKRFDDVEKELESTRKAVVSASKAVGALRTEFHGFGQQVAKILANHRRRISALERRRAA